MVWGILSCSVFTLAKCTRITSQKQRARKKEWATETERHSKSIAIMNSPFAFFQQRWKKNVLLILFAFHVQDLWLNLINNRNTDHTGKEDKRRKKYLFRAWYEWVVKMTSIWIEEWTSAKARNGSDYEPNDGKIVNRVQTRFKFKRIKRERERKISEWCAILWLMWSLWIHKLASDRRFLLLLVLLKASANFNAVSEWNFHQ